MKKLLFTVIGVLLLSSSMFAQSISISDADFGPSNPITCANYQDGGAQNFFDNGGAGNYPPNSNETITICPNLPDGPKVTVVFATNTGFTFDVHPSDTIYVYDGPNTSAPLLGAHNSATSPNGFTYTASFENNPTGCLTIVFHSDGANEGSGWDGGITCGNPPQPFYPHIEAFVNGSSVNALNPIDTGYVDVCLGDTIMLVAKPVFPYSNETAGFGYSQTLTNIDYEWEIANTPVGGNNDTIYYIPQSRNGFYVRLNMEDIFPQIIQTFCKIRVSQLPSFAGTGPLQDIICINETTELVGGATATDTVGVAFPPGAFILGGTVAGLTYLPDGSGQNYSTTINMSDFEVGAVFSDPSDLQSVCLTMEHSYLGDLEMWLTCPNGTEVTLFNANTGGYIPGGFGGGGTYLGGANDTGNGSPGVGMEYCFSSVNNTWGNFPSQFQIGNFIQAGTPMGNAMNPNGVYLPEEPFSAFNGCPMNGDWTITVRDNLAIDDGYIFEWGLLFNPNLFPNNESYLNSIVDEYWVNDPSIIGGVNDTAIVVFPPGPGVHNYTFVVEDNYGCFYDTTVSVTVKQPIVLNLPDTICTLSYTSTLSTGTNDGVWSFYNSPATPTFAVNDVNTTITFPSFGLYHLVYSDTSCTDKDTAVILVEQSPFFNFDSDFFTCSPFDAEYLYFADSNLVQSFSWGLVNPAEDTLFTANLYPGGGIYTASYVSNFGCERDTTFTITTRPDNVIPNYGLVCGTALEMNQNTGLDGGTWTSPNGNGNVSFSPTNTIITTVTVTAPGTYTLVYTDECGTDQVNVEFNQGPSLQVSDGITCVGESFNPTVINVLPNTSYVWNTGETSTSITVDIPGDYVVVATNSCGSVADTVTLQVIPCVIDVPNVFTPNGDGFNDTFGMIDAQGLLNFKCTILNRWGNVVRDFDDPAFEWDGTDKNGTQVTEGVYFYIINTANILGDQIEKHGSVTLIKN
jgi:gliding motility-associated-like protein